MLKATAQEGTISRDPWPIGLRLLGAASATVISGVLLRDPRPALQSRTVLVLVAAAEVLLLVVGGWLVSSRAADVWSGFIAFVGATATASIGGLAFIVPVFLYLAASTVGRWSPAVRVGVRVIAAVLFLLTIAPTWTPPYWLPVLIPLLAWSSTNAKSWTRHVWAVLAGFCSLVAVGWLQYVTGLVDSRGVRAETVWTIPIVVGLGVYLFLAFRLRAQHEIQP